MVEYSIRSYFDFITRLILKFCSFVFYLVSVILFEKFSICFHLKSIFDVLKYIIIGCRLSANFSKEIAKLFPGSAKVLLHEKNPNTEFFLVRIFLYSEWIQENTDQEKLRIWTIFTQYFYK